MADTLLFEAEDHGVGCLCADTDLLKIAFSVTLCPWVAVVIFIQGMGLGEGEMVPSKMIP